MHALAVKQNSIREILEHGAGTLLDFLYGDEQKTARTLGLAFLTLGLGMMLYSTGTGAACAV